MYNLSLLETTEWKPWWDRKSVDLKHLTREQQNTLFEQYRCWYLKQMQTTHYLWTA